MAAWTAADNTTWMGASWVADMGPWTGAPPDPIPTLPTDADEIDYLLGVPDPSGDVTLFVPDYHTYTYRFAGGISTTSGGRDPSPGSHLVIVFYQNGYPDPVTTLPAETPDSLMPGAGPPPPPPPPPPVQSIITFHSFNLDPLFSGGTPDSPFYGTVGYGGVVGGDDCLDTADGDASYIRFFPTLGGAPAMVTCRATADPPIPADAVPFPGAPTADDTHNSHEQVRLETFNDYTNRPIWVLFHADPLLTTSIWGSGVVAVGAASPRNGSTDPLWGTSWWDNSNMGSSGGYSGTYIPDGGRFLLRALQAGGYFIIGGGNGYPDQDHWTRVSQLVLALTWQPVTAAVVEDSRLRLAQRDDTRGIIPHPARLGATQKRNPARVGGANTYT